MQSFAERIRIMDAFKSLVPGIPFTESDSLTLLEAPLLDEGIPAEMEKKSVMIGKIVSKLPLLERHHGLFIYTEKLCMRAQTALRDAVLSIIPLSGKT